MARGEHSKRLHLTAGGRFSGRPKEAGKPVVVLADLPHSDQRLQVLVGLVGVDVVQGAAVPGVSVGGGEVNGNLTARIRQSEMSNAKLIFCRHVTLFFLCVCVRACARPFR